MPMEESQALSAADGETPMRDRTDYELLSPEDIFFLLAAISPHRSNAMYNTLFEKLSDFLTSKDLRKNPH